MADILAPVEAWEGIKKRKCLVSAGQLEEGSLLHCGWLINYFQEIGVPLHPNLQREFAALSSKLVVSDTFFDKSDIFLEE